MNIWLITRFTLLEAVRRRIFLAVLILSLLSIATFTILLNVAIDATLSDPSSFNGDPQLFLLSSGVFVAVLVTWMVYLLSSALTIIMTAGMISGEVESGTFAVIVPKPLTRTEIVLGKWLGYALILSVYTALLFLSFLGVIYWKTGYWPTSVFNALGMLELIVLALLGLTTLGSTLVPTIVNGAIALVLFILAPISSIIQFIVQVLKPVQSPAIQDITTVINLIIPTDALWHGVSYFLLPPVASLVTLGLSQQNFNTPFTSAEPVAAALVIWVIIYCLALPALAALRFQHRDL